MDNHGPVSARDVVPCHEYLAKKNGGGIMGEPYDAHVRAFYRQRTRVWAEIMARNARERRQHADPTT